MKSAIPSSALRRLAEEKAARSPKNLGVLSLDETQQTLHELLVHQIELEIQNVELRQAQEELNAARERYFNLYELVPVGYCTLNEKGVILETNLTASTLLGITRSELINQPITRFILPEDQDIYYLYCKQLSETGTQKTCELRILRAGTDPVWLRLEASICATANTPGESPGLQSRLFCA